MNSKELAKLAGNLYGHKIEDLSELWDQIGNQSLSYYLEDNAGELAPAVETSPSPSNGSSEKFFPAFMLDHNMLEIIDYINRGYKPYIIDKTSIVICDPQRAMPKPLKEAGLYWLPDKIALKIAKKFEEIANDNS